MALFRLASHEQLQKSMEALPVRTVDADPLRPRGGMRLQQDKCQTDAIGARANDLRIHRDRTIRISLGDAGSLQQYPDQCARIPALLRQQVEPGRTDIPDVMRQGSRTIPVMGDQVGYHSPRGPPSFSS